MSDLTPAMGLTQLGLYIPGPISPVPYPVGNHVQCSTLPILELKIMKTFLSFYQKIRGRGVCVCTLIEIAQKLI